MRRRYVTHNAVANCSSDTSGYGPERDLLASSTRYHAKTAGRLGYPYRNGQRERLRVAVLYTQLRLQKIVSYSEVYFFYRRRVATVYHHGLRCADAISNEAKRQRPGEAEANILASSL